ncbi:hypothetical protein ACFS5J_09215 [Flavobacterium chuncheonense]|uniref:Uncharacterized protein n=1 Tax=Flavobacterium chuncheonense TaxID=2026653 RepID=A0ABW5YMD7_9FLAO
MLKRIILIVSVSLIFTNFSNAQGYGKSNNPAYQAYYDSIKTMDYNHTFPILGKKAYKRGYDVPYPWGISAVFFTQKQEINIKRTSIGFNGGDKVDLSNYINFGPTIATTNAYTVRPDLWILPFLNVYAIMGGGTTQTEVTLLNPISIETTQRFDASSFGVGATLAGAIGPVWIAWDNNYNFADVDVVVEPIPAFNSSLRVGHTFMDPIKPTRTLSVWVGTFYQSIQNDTEGSIAIQDVFPNFGDGSKIADLREWADGLPLAQRVVANQIINKLEDISNGIDPGEATIDYKLDKEVAAPFNLIFGAQYQFNKNWIVRTELGVFGKRSQFMLNLNYRFQGF